VKSAFNERAARIRNTLIKGCLYAFGRRDALFDRLETIDIELRGFAFEGAGFGLALIDALWPGPDHRLREYVSHPRNPFRHLIYTGAGAVLLCAPWRMKWFCARLEPLLAWLPAEGHGFFKGLLWWKTRLGDRPRPRGLHGHLLRAFDQGLGRSMWFLLEGNVDLIEREIQRFEPSRRKDAWVGLGLACGYAGGVDRETLKSLFERAGDHQPDLAVGIGIACYLRTTARIPGPNTELAASVIWDSTTEEVGTMFERSIPDAYAPAKTSNPDLDHDFDVWRERVAGELIARRAARRRSVA
jgi:hypothetical protein